MPSPGGLPVEGEGDAIGRFEVSEGGVSFSSRPWSVPEAVTLAVVAEPHRPYPHKTTDREQFDLALEEARTAGADEPLLLTGAGEVAECARWGVFWWEEDVVCGPALDLGILPGVGRARLAELVGPIAERRVRSEALVGRAMFLANAARGVVPVCRVGELEVPSSPLTTQLARLFWG